MSEDGRGDDRRDGGDKPRGPPPVNHMFTVKIDNLYRSTSVEILKEAFNKFGEIGDVYIPKDRNTGDGRGFGFVRFIVEADADDAIKEMDGTDLDGNVINASMAKEKRPDFDRRGGFGRGRGGYGYDDRRGGGGYNDRRGGYDDRRGGGYDRGYDRRDDRRGGYDDRRGGRSDDRKSGYYDDDDYDSRRRGGYRSRSRSRSRDYGRRDYY